MHSTINTDVVITNFTVTDRKPYEIMTKSVSEESKVLINEHGEVLDILPEVSNYLKKLTPELLTNSNSVELQKISHKITREIESWEEDFYPGMNREEFIESLDEVIDFLAKSEKINLTTISETKARSKKLIEIAQSDPDQDGLSTAKELLLRTEPLVADTDKDGIDDGKEIQLGTDPNIYDISQQERVKQIIPDLLIILNTQEPTSRPMTIIQGKEHTLTWDNSLGCLTLQENKATTPKLKAILKGGIMKVEEATLSLDDVNHFRNAAKELKQQNFQQHSSGRSR